MTKKSEKSDWGGPAAIAGAAIGSAAITAALMYVTRRKPAKPDVPPTAPPPETD
jgi:hypothetical protein